MNRLVLVNKYNKLSKSFMDDIVLVEVLVGEYKYLVEEETYESYLKLKDFLLEKGIVICISSAFRSFERQGEIYEEFVKKYGKEYADKIVSPIGCSEHHTGLAIDVVIMVDGKFLTSNYELMEHEDVYLEIHKYLSKFGFILRYMKGKEDITGYPYEPWHIRYVGKEHADYIYRNSLTLEEYLYEKGFI